MQSPIKVPFTPAGASHEDIEAYFAGIGQPAYRATQLCNWIFQKDVRDIAAFTNMSRPLREQLMRDIRLPQYRILDHQRSGDDGTRKLLLEFADGACVETVIIPVRDKLTQCISTQVGCRMGCRFCMTGSAGLQRQLSADEIIAQVFAVRDVLKEPERIGNFVFMGMGEPLDNYDASARAVRTLTDARMLGYSHRHVTISTCGLIEGIRRMGAEELPCHLALSLHGTTDEQRNAIMPVNRSQGLDQLLRCLREYPLRNRKRITIEYLLIRDHNDGIEDARRLARLLAGVRCKINLIPYNEHPAAAFRAPDPEQVLRFQRILTEKHYTTLIRRSGGADIDAACGQLAGKRAEQGGSACNART